jgi:hypothetical protein
MRRRSARSAFSTAQLALWDELETVKPAPAAAAPAPVAAAPRPAPAPSGAALHAAQGSAR